MSEKRVADPAGTLVLEMEDAVLFKDDEAPEPDPEWIYADPDGHEHRWKFLRPNLADTDPEGASPSLPTLRYVADSDGAHYACRECGWPVQPGKRPKGSGHFRPSRRVYRVNGRVVSEGDARMALSLIKALHDAKALPESPAVSDDKQ